MTLLEATIRDAMKKAIDTGAVRDALLEIMNDPDLWKEIDTVLADEMKRSKCYLTFYDNRPQVLVGLGDGDATISIDIENTLDFSEPLNDDDRRNHIVGLETMIATLQQHKARLENGARQPG